MYHRACAVGLPLLFVAACADGPRPDSTSFRIPEPHLPSVPDETESAPWIAAVEPPSAAVAETIRITGEGFGEEPGAVRVGGRDATVASWSDTTIDIRLPDVFPGSRDVIVEVGVASAGASIEVVLPPVAFLNEDRVSGNAIAAVRIPLDAAPETLPYSPFPTGASAAGFGGDARSVVLHASTRRLFATNEDSVSVFDVDGATGALHPVPGSPFAAGATRCFGLAVSPEGTRVFVASYAASSVAVLAVADTGALTPVPGSPFDLSAGGGPDSLQLTPDGKRLYVNLEDLQAMEVLAVDEGGSLVRIEGSPFPYGAGSFAYSIRLDPQGRYAYVSDTFQERIAAYRLDPTTGAPTEIAGSPFAASGMVHGLAFSPGGRTLFAATDDPAALIHVFTVAEEGSLSPIDGSPFSSGLGDTSSIEVGENGRRLYVVDESANRMAVFRIGEFGAPELLSMLTIDVAEGQPSGMAISR